MSQPSDSGPSRGKSRGGSSSQLYRPSRDEGDRRYRERDGRSGNRYSGKNKYPPPETTAPPTILLKSRATETRSLSPVNHCENSPAPVKDQFKVPVIKRDPLASSSNPFVPLPMTGSVKILTEDLLAGFQNNLQEYLSEDHDFLVVGCVGSQWSGKSTLLSHLAASDHSNFVHQTIFNVATSATQMKGSPGTVGLDAFITSDRVIWLDCQPLMSAALAEKELTSNYSKEYGKEATLSSCSCVGTLVEVQSIQLVSLLYCICHVLLVIQDSLADPNLIRLLQTAEMLKPNLVADDPQQPDILPHLVTIYNRARPADLVPEVLRAGLRFHKLAFQKSRLQTHSSAVGAGLKIFPDEVNFTVLPNWRTSSRPDAVVNGDYEKAVLQLKRALLALPRRPFNMGTTVLSEKSWFTFAGKAWEAVRKSSLMMEYARLLQ